MERASAVQESSHADYLLRARELELKQLRDERDRSYALLNARVADLQGTLSALLLYCLNSYVLSIVYCWPCATTTDVDVFVHV